MGASVHPAWAGGEWTLSPGQFAQVPGLMASVSPPFPQRRTHSLVRTEIHYLHQRAQPVSQQPLQAFPLRPRLSLVPSLPHPAYSQPQANESSAWGFRETGSSCISSGVIKKVPCPQMTGWTSRNSGGLQAFLPGRRCSCGSHSCWVTLWADPGLVSVALNSAQAFGIGHRAARCA